MELKYAILLITSLCVIFIIVEELFQSRAYFSGWNAPKSRFVASIRMEDFAEEKHEDLLTENDMQHGWQGRKPKSKVDPPRPAKKFFDFEDVLSDKRWKEWKVKMGQMPTDVPRKRDKESGKERKKMKKQKNKGKERYWKDYGDEELDEEEKLRRSPYIYHEEEEEMERLRNHGEETEMKYVSFFMPFEKNEHKSQKSFKFCRYNRCAITRDMTKADWIGIKAATIRDHAEDVVNFHHQRPQGQRWFMYTIDPSIRGFGLGKDEVKSLFNATLTYNRDADIPIIFGRLRKVPLFGTRDYGKIYDGKTKMAAWFVSHCETPSRREGYVERMEASMTVDIYGACGNLTCGLGRGPISRSNDSSICFPMLSKDYKFYLAFENAFCKDYVTEKFFKLFRGEEGVQTIPVVRGGFEYKKYLPSGIFVNADDFESPEALSEYLKELGNDKQRYTDMLRKKDEWRLIKPTTFQCAVCKYIHSNPSPKFYPNLKDKFGSRSCYYPKNIGQRDGWSNDT